MMFSDANQKVEELYETFGEKKNTYRMAKVAELSSGRPVLLFSGETSNSVKLYKYLASYTPAVGDTVLLARTGNTYVILGKVV